MFLCTAHPAKFSETIEDTLGIAVPLPPALAAVKNSPASKLFAFGGDTRWPTSSVAYAIQSRRWLNRALQGEVDDGLLTEAEAIELATRFMRGNQQACFDLAGTRQTLNAG